MRAKRSSFYVLSLMLLNLGLGALALAQTPPLDPALETVIQDQKRAELISQVISEVVQAQRKVPERALSKREIAFLRLRHPVLAQGIDATVASAIDISSLQEAALAGFKLKFENRLWQIALSSPTWEYPDFGEPAPRAGLRETGSITDALQAPQGQTFQDRLRNMSDALAHLMVELKNSRLYEIHRALGEEPGLPSGLSDEQPRPSTQVATEAFQLLMNLSLMTGSGRLTAYGRLNANVMFYLGTFVASVVSMIPLGLFSPHSVPYALATAMLSVIGAATHSGLRDLGPVGGRALPPMPGWQTFYEAVFLSKRAQRAVVNGIRYSAQTEELMNITSVGMPEDLRFREIANRFNDQVWESPETEPGERLEEFQTVVHRILETLVRESKLDPSALATGIGCEARLM